jgi:hypothetical protein
MINCKGNNPEAITLQNGGSTALLAGTLHTDCMRFHHPRPLRKYGDRRTPISLIKAVMHERTRPPLFPRQAVRTLGAWAKKALRSLAE